jgi:hypothetical protein
VDFSKTSYESNFEKSHLEVDPEDYDDTAESDDEESDSDDEVDDEEASVVEEGQEVEVERVWRIGAPIPVRIHGN